MDRHKYDTLPQIPSKRRATSPIAEELTRTKKPYHDLKMANLQHDGFNITNGLTNERGTEWNEASV